METVEQQNFASAEFHTHSRDVDRETCHAHNLPASWTATLQWGGTPGALVIPVTFAIWLDAHFNAVEMANPAITGPDAGPDGDGLSNLIQFTLGTMPDKASSRRLTALPACTVAPGPDTLDHLIATWTVSTQPLASVTLTAEAGSDLSGWTPLSLLNTTPNADGTTTLVFRDPTTWLSARRRFFRMRITAN